MMRLDHLQAVEQIFHAALEREPSELAAFLEEKCAGDAALRREVEALLHSYQRADDFIETPIVSVDSRIFDIDQADRLVGQLLGRYKILKPLGIGGMGIVYLARRADQQYEKLVAIKLIKRGMDTDSVLRHFHNERQILASFDHPNIARMLDGDTTESGLPYFVMEYVEGLPIDTYCDTHALPITERLKLFRRVCSAVTYAHRHAVIHRDIKASNIFVSTDGVPKLLDFGIAKILQSGEGNQPSATMMGMRVMTPEYASPEQVRGEPLTTATDVYSLGVVLYQLLTGRLPYRITSQSPYEIARVVSEAEPQRPSTVIPAETGDSTHVPEGSVERLRRRLRGDLDNIVLMALRKEASRRYQSVEQFSDDIRRHLETLPVLARKDTLGYRTVRFVQRKRALTASAALLSLTLVGGIVATSWQAHRARQQESFARAEKARAERRFNDVRKLANFVLFDYYDSIRDLSGATAARERLVKDALVYLDSLAGEASSDPALQRELAVAYERVGDVRGEALGNATLGDTAGATDSYMKALHIREAIVRSSPADLQARIELATCYVKLGTQQLETVNASRGMEYLNMALALYSQLRKEQPGNAQIRRELANTHSMLGLALEDVGDAAGALRNQQAALELREQEAAADPGNQASRRKLSVAYINLGRALVLTGEVKAGLKTNEKALAICTDVFAADPRSASARRLLANTYQNDGDYRAILHDTRGALQSFRKKLELDEKAVADDPLNATALGDLGYSQERIADLLAETGEYRDALVFRRRALANREKTAAKASESITANYGVIINHAALGVMHAQLGHRPDALKEFSTAIALLGKIPANPASTLDGSKRAQVYIHLGDTHAALAKKILPRTDQREHWLTARTMYSKSLDIWNEMKRRGILTGEDADKPREVARSLAQCEVFLKE